MGIAHGDDADVILGPVEIDTVGECAGLCLEGNIGRLESRNTHVDANLAVFLEIECDAPFRGADVQLVAAAECLVADIARETAGAVAALLDLAAIGVEDAVVKLGTLDAWPFNQQDLVTADAEMAVGDLPQLFGAQVDLLFDGIENDEIVSRALHLGEFQFHGRSLHGFSRFSLPAADAPRQRASRVARALSRDAPGLHRRALPLRAAGYCSWSSS